MKAAIHVVRQHDFGVAVAIDIGGRHALVVAVDHEVVRVEGFELVVPVVHDHQPEATAVGVPVLASNVGGLAELVEHRKTGLLVEPQYSEQLAASIVELVGDGALQTSLAKAARAKAERFDVARMIDAYTDCYRTLL